MKKHTYWTVVAVIDSWQVFGPLLLETGSEDYVRRGYELKKQIKKMLNEIRIP